MSIIVNVYSTLKIKCPICANHFDNISLKWNDFNLFKCKKSATLLSATK